MHISSLSIRNFRNFRSAKLKFTKGINTIIGENGSGKTNLFYALRILLDNTLPRHISFYETDFNRSIGIWKGHWLIISIVFEELDANEEAQALAIQTCGQMDQESKGTYSVYFRPKYEFRKRIYEYSLREDKNSEGLKDILYQLSLADYETVYSCRGEADFSDDEIYRQYVGDFEKIEFPNPDDKEKLALGIPLPSGISIHNEVSCTFIKALRDVESDLRSYANNPLLNLLRGKEKTVKITNQKEIIDGIENLNEQISSLEEVKEIRRGVDKSIKETVGTTYAPNIDIRSELPNEMEKLFQSLKLWVGDPDDLGYKGKIWELSLGGANLIYLSLKLLEYEKVKSDRIANFLFIEEPEAHIHTHIQKTLFNSLKENKTQVIISTHSTHISSVSKIKSVNILSRENQRSLVFYPAHNLEQSQTIRIERYLDAVRSNLLFAKGVVLVEGDAELILIPEMFKKVFGLSLDEIGVSLINIGSTGFENIAQIFHADRIQKHCSILTDNDQSIIPLPDEPDTDDDYQKHCRKSQESGLERKKQLTDFCKGNSFLKLFFAEHTFEVDLLMNNNSYEYVQCLKNIYQQDKYIKQSKSKLENKSVEIAGKEVLRIADKVGKGWLALLVAEELVYNTYIPNYILDAIAFAAYSLNESSKVKAILYRLMVLSENDNNNYQEEASKFLIEGKSEETIINEFCDTFQDDQLTKFLKLL